MRDQLRAAAVRNYLLGMELGGRGGAALCNLAHVFDGRARLLEDRRP